MKPRDWLDAGPKALAGAFDHVGCLIPGAEVSRLADTLPLRPLATTLQLICSPTSLFPTLKTAVCSMTAAPRKQVSLDAPWLSLTKTVQDLQGSQAVRVFPSPEASARDLCDLYIASEHVLLTFSPYEAARLDAELKVSMIVMDGSGGVLVGRRKKEQI